MQNFTIQEAAPVLGIRPTTVQAHIARGNLQSFKRGGAHYITNAEIQRFKKERRHKAGRPKSRAKHAV